MCFILQVSDHEHEADESLLTSSKVFADIKSKIEEDPTLPIKRSFDEVLARYDDELEDEDELPSFSQLRTRLQRARAATLPPLPQAIDDVQIRGDWARTWRGDRFRSHIDNDWGILVFSTTENICILRQCSKIYLDGTFKTCPHPYTQFVTLHGKYLGQVFTLAMCLMTGKTVGQYRQFLQHSKQQVRNVTHHRWRPPMAICDFEQAIILAIETELPNTRIGTCYFHFCQSLWRKIQELGLVTTYRRRPRARNLIRKIMAIGFLPVPLVTQNFNMLTGDRATVRLINRYHSLRDFITYVTNTYIQGTFPTAMWNVYERGSDCRTNNIVEGMYILQFLKK